MRRKSKKGVNPGVLNLIAPMGVKVKHNSIQFSDQTGRVYGAQKYPPLVSTGWLTNISNLPGTITSIVYAPVEPGVMIDAVSKNIQQSQGVANSARDPLIRQRAERAVADGERVLAQIDQTGETVGMMTVLVMPHAADEQTFQLTCRKTEGTFKSAQIRARGAAFQQEEAFQMLSPYQVPNLHVQARFERLTPLSSLMGGFPFSTPGYHDGGGGCYVAKDTAGGLIVLDLWKRGGDRTNSNMVFTGISGQGKSTAIKSIMISEFMRGTTVIAIDPENEYLDLCRALGGDWINTGGGAGGRINPLQIRSAPRDESEETNGMDNQGGIGNLALHLKTLDIFFSLYLPNMGDREKMALKWALEYLYKQFGITWETDTGGIPGERYPTFSNLYALLQAIVGDMKGRGRDATDFERLAFMLRDIAEGADQFFWNGHTTVRAESQFICFSTHDLQNTGENVKRTQYFNLLSWCWQRMSRDRRERVLLVADEAYIMVDPKVPQSLEFLRNVSKRARKYEAAIAIVSQSVIDFLDPSVQMYGQSLLDMPCYKFLFGCDGQSLHDLARLYNLNEAEQALLLSKKQGNALFMVGSRRLHAIFQIPGYKLEAMGSGGGR